MSGSLDSASFIPSAPLTALEANQGLTHLRGGEAESSDWRYWLARAYRAWLARQEQLSLFEDWVA